MAKEKVLLSRGELVSRLGVWSPDLVLVAFMCPRCSRFIDERAEQRVTSVAYRDLDGLIAHAHKLAAQELPEGLRPICPPCEVRGRAVSIDYHAYHSGMSSDLVVRCFKKTKLFGKGRQEILWCDPKTTEALPAEIDDTHKTAFQRDALLRAARTAAENGNADAPSLIEKVLERFPGDKQLVELAWLILSSQQMLAHDIAAAHLGSHPQDTEGHALLGSAVLEQMKSGRLPSSHLDDAEGHMNLALQNDPGHVRALFGRTVILRMRGDRAAARWALEDLVARHPAFAAGLHDLALLELEDRAEAALAHFEQAAALQPENVEHAIGRVRAFLRMGRSIDARTALEAVRKLDPANAHLPSLENKVVMAQAAPREVTPVPASLPSVQGTGAHSVPIMLADNDEDQRAVLASAPAPAPRAPTAPPEAVTGQSVPILLTDFEDNAHDTVPDGGTHLNIASSTDDHADDDAGGLSA